jgi:tetratricopeptide (TPR) repeat protein
MQSRRWNDGEVALRRALELGPNNSSASEYLALLLEQKGRVEESVKITREVANANPVAVDFQRLYASSLYRARRYDEAIEQCQRILELDPTHLVTYATLATALVEKGRYQEAGEALAPGNWTSPGVRAWLYAREGNQAAARQIVLQNPSLLDAHFAVARYLLGEQEAALAELDYLANEMWSTRTYNLRNDPAFDPMRGDPRFNAIVKKTGLLDK